jgi:hypothetical protein
MPDSLQGGFTVPDLARRWRVGEDKIRAWIKAGALEAINTSATTCGKPRYLVTPEALERFEQCRRVGPAPKAQRSKRKSAAKDYYPD